MLKFIESLPQNAVISLKYVKITHFNVCYTISQSEIIILNIHDYFKIFKPNFLPQKTHFPTLNSMISYLEKSL
jgi:hypothetical protein